MLLFFFLVVVVVFGARLKRLFTGCYPFLLTNGCRLFCLFLSELLWF